MLNRVLGDGWKGGIDGIDDVVVGECFEKMESVLEFLDRLVGECEWVLLKENVIEGG